MHFKYPWERTYAAVQSQLTGMGAEVFEVGALQRGDGDKPQFMLLRTWDQKNVIESIPWLLFQNWRGSHIYVRPKGESNLTLVDDLVASAVTRMRQEGFQPAVVVQTSPGNYQAWIKHGIRLDPELGTAVARDLARRFGGDEKAAAWRHFGRMVGFRNTKAKHKETVAVPEYDAWRGQYFHRNLEGQWVGRGGSIYTEEQLHAMHARLAPRARFPFVRLVEASGVVARGSEPLVAEVRAAMEKERLDRARAAHSRSRSRGLREPEDHLKSIDAFRADPRYGGDGTRVDLAYAVYAVARGADIQEVTAALRSRDLSHKGNEKRQNDYVERTVRKALASVEQGRGR